MGDLGESGDLRVDHFGIFSTSESSTVEIFFCSQLDTVYHGDGPPKPTDHRNQCHQCPFGKTPMTNTPSPIAFTVGSAMQGFHSQLEDERETVDEMQHIFLTMYFHVIADLSHVCRKIERRHGRVKYRPCLN